MKRLIAAGTLGVAVSLLAGSLSFAAPPESAEDAFEVPSCGFPVQVTTTGKVKYIQHGDQLITIAPAQKATLTNPSTGESISVNLAGAFHETVLPNGDLVGRGTGHNVFGGPGAGGIIYTTGNVSYTQDADTGVVTFTRRSAKMVNLCDALA
jgi:hypothetical protein